MDFLSSEVKVAIFGFLEAKELYCVSLVCTEWSDLFKERNSWGAAVQSSNIPLKLKGRKFVERMTELNGLFLDIPKGNLAWRNKLDFPRTFGGFFERAQLLVTQALINTASTTVNCGNPAQNLAWQYMTGFDTAPPQCFVVLCLSLVPDEVLEAYLFSSIYRHRKTMVKTILEVCPELAHRPIKNFDNVPTIATPKEHAMTVGYRPVIDIFY